MSFRGPLLGGLGGCLLLAWAPPAIAQQQIVHFSVDWQGPTISLPDSSFLTPVTEADILVPGQGAPGFGPLPVPSILFSGGAAPIPGLGLALYPGCVGHAPGIPCGIEVDALSFGLDFPLPTGVPVPPHCIAFSTDEYAVGLVGIFAPPTVWTEGPPADLAGDLLVSGGLGPIPSPPFTAPNPGSVAILDGDGFRSPSGYLYPGIGLVEPRIPFAGLPNPGDGLDALEIDPGVPQPALYFSLDAGWPDPLTGLAHSASAVAHFFSGGDVLVTVAPGAGPPVIYAPAPLLGLDLQGGDTDDLDALILWENGDGVFQPSQQPGDWQTGQTDMLVFSVRRGSAVVGAPDSIFGLPIEPGDLLTTPLPPALGGLSPFPGLLISAEDLGLSTVRSGSPEPFGDELDAADSLPFPVFDCDGNGVEDAIDIATGAATDLDSNGIPDVCQPILTYCTCPAPQGPCGNNDPNAGCANSTGVGALLFPTGSNSVGLDDLVLSGIQLPQKVFGLMISGSSPVGPLVFGDGLRCAGGLVTRWPIQSSGTSGTMAYGPGLSAYSVANFALARRLLPGTTWHFQLWYRDPNGPCGKTFNLSNAVRVMFVP